MRNLHIVGTTAVSPPLIERGVELDALRAAVRAGSGVVILEAAAGLGKSALLEHGAALAAEAGFQVRRALPGPLERHFPYGVIRALLEAPVREAPEPLDGAAAAAGALLLRGAAPGEPMLIAHSVLWLCSALAERRPLALVIDDAQWADRASLEVLAYLARRVEDFPLLILVATRAPAADALGAVPSVTVMTLRPLSPRGATRLIQRLAPDTPEAVCGECHHEVGGNPWLITELGRQLAAHGCTGDHVTPLARHVIRRRLAELSPRDRGVIEALAVIGDATQPHVVASVAGLPVGELAPARDALVATGLLTGDGFAHPLIAAAIAADLPPTERERLHREAARVLMAGNAEGRLVASHLLETGPQADPEISDYLLCAARAAARQGVPGAAATYLERALEERAPGDDRGQMLTLLGAASFDAGLPDTRRQLHEALREVGDRERRIDVLTSLAALNLVDNGDEHDLVELFDRALREETNPHARLRLEAAALDVLVTAPERHAERVRRVHAFELPEGADPLLARVISAHQTAVEVEIGTPSASHWAAQARRALEGGHLLSEARRRAAYVLCLRVLVMTDDPAAKGAIEALRIQADEAGSVRARAAATWHASEHEMRCGHVVEAERLARLALELVGDEHNWFSGGAAEVLVRALAERGALAEARAFLRERGFEGELGTSLWAFNLHHARARLHLAEGDFERAHAEALAAARSLPPRPPEPLVHALALDRFARALAPRAARGGRRSGERRARIGRALRRAGADRDRAARARRRPARSRRAGGALRAGAGGSRRRPGGRPRPAGARGRACLHGPTGQGPRGAAARARRRRRARGDAARPARPPRARGHRPASAPGGDRGHGRAHPAPAPDLRAGGGRQGQPRDRAGAVPLHQDRRDPPRGGLSQAGGEHARRAGGGAGRVGRRAEEFGVPAISPWPGLIARGASATA